jgi:hypothetical protein
MIIDVDTCERRVWRARPAATSIAFPAEEIREPTEQAEFEVAAVVIRPRRRFDSALDEVGASPNRVRHETRGGPMVWRP